MDYQKLFLQRWKELKNEIEPEKENGGNCHESRSKSKIHY